MEFLQTDRDKEILKEYTSKIEKPNCYLELGTHHGGSALFAVENTERPVYSIDNICKLQDELLCNPKFNFILGNSVDLAKIWNKSIGLLFIDGDHFIAGKDFEVWKDKVVGGGYVLFHDYIKHAEWNVTADCDNIIEEYKSEYKLIYKPDNTKDKTSILILQKI